MPPRGLVSTTGANTSSANTGERTTFVTFRSPPSSSAPLPNVASGDAQTAVAGEETVLKTRAGPDAPLCRFFNTHRGCQFGAQCRNRHVVTITAGPATTSGTSGRADASSGGSHTTVNNNAQLNVGSSQSVTGPSSSSSKSIPCRYYAAGTCLIFSPLDKAWETTGVGD